ncbi:MAG: class I SAM-dependent methyltransferase [Planctomycetes bacterium]|nr:class I SAM-dependent methyltransferase [Planctomycetota bacterium]
MHPADLRSRLGATDIALLDQILKGRLDPPLRLLDAGCGGGRNLTLFRQEGYEVHAVDLVPRDLPGFREAPVERLPYEDRFFDAVLCIAVLHFARDRTHFEAMTREMGRVLRPGGLFFARLSTTLGRGAGMPPPPPDWFLADGPLLAANEAMLDAERLDPLKTVVVDGLRTMTTWVLRKGQPR